MAGLLLDPGQGLGPSWSPESWLGMTGPRASCINLNVEASRRRGCRALRKAQVTGTVVGLYSAKPAGFLEGEGDYVTQCEEHGHFVHHNRLKDAKAALSRPDKWCPACSGRKDKET